MSRRPWALVAWKKRRQEILKTRDHCEWCGKSKLEVPLTMDHIVPSNSLTDENYMAIRNEDILILCNRCAYARKKGKILCKKCKKHYHNPRYPQCYLCNIEDKKNEILCKKCKEHYHSPKYPQCLQCEDEEMDEEILEIFRREKRERES